MPETPQDHILRLAAQLAGSEDKAHRWYHHEPLPAFDGQTPEQLVAQGRALDLLRYLHSLEAGFGG